MVIIAAVPVRYLEPATSLPGHLWDWGLRLKTQSTEFILPAQEEFILPDLFFLSRWKGMLEISKFW